MKILTKDDLILALKDIRKTGWIENAHPGNAGGVGNTLEDLLGIEENNLPIPNAAEWELKCQRSDTTSLITLFHSEPSCVVKYNIIIFCQSVKEFYWYSKKNYPKSFFTMQ
ncbi:MAG: MvaI/BcnI family restriction endonuclease [candidate division WOR-3 bacterium]